MLTEETLYTSIKGIVDKSLAATSLEELQELMGETQSLILESNDCGLLDDLIGWEFMCLETCIGTRIYEFIGGEEVTHEVTSVNPNFIDIYDI